MAHRVPAGLTKSEGRRFGLAVGGILVGLGLIAIWRGHPVSSKVMLVIGGLLFLGGALIPGRLGPVYRAWMGLALVMSKVTTPIVMGALYFLVLTPVGLIRRALGKNAMIRAEENGSYWVAREPGGRPATHLERQF